MALKVVNTGKVRLMDIIRTFYNTTTTLQLGLFQNNWTPADGDTILQATEATYPGYARVGITPWSLPFMVGNHAYTAGPPVVFLVTGNATPNDVYGYFVFDNLLGDIVWAERLPNVPRAMHVIGDTLAINPALTGTSEF